MSFEPETFEAAATEKKWVAAMQDEIDVIVKNNTWQLVDRPKNKDVVGVKWIFKTKLNVDGSVQKHKARLVAKGYSQKPGVDYFETFAPVARLETIRGLISIAAQKGWNLYQLDVKSAFLNGKLEEDVFIEQPQGFEIERQENQVYKLNKALYGLKQSPRAWYGEIDSYFTKEGFKRSQNEPALYTKTGTNSKILIVSLYVDDLIFTGNCDEMITSFKNDMMKTYEMNDLGLLHYFLGISIDQSSEGIFISQEKYAHSILEKFKMLGCNPVVTPLIVNEKFAKEDGSGAVDEGQYRSLIGSLLYLTATRPDIMYGACLLSRFMHNPTQIHYGAAKRILRYIQGTMNYGIMYERNVEPKLLGYCDIDWGGSVDDKKSTSGYIFTMGTGVFSWASTKQKSVALSTAEAEYVAASMATSQAVWLRRIIKDFGEEQKEATTIMVDNKSAIAMSKNPVYHSKAKHIALKVHYIRDAVEENVVDLVYCKSENQVADIFTKALPREKFVHLRELLGMKQKSIKEEC